MSTISAQSDETVHFKVQQIELIPLNAAQDKSVHFTFRPFIEFNYIDTYGALQPVQTAAMMQNVQIPPAMGCRKDSSPIDIPTCHNSRYDFAQQYPNYYPPFQGQMGEADADQFAQNINDFVNDLIN